jgi:hypothetical protein
MSDLARDHDHPFFERMREQIVATPLPARRRSWLGSRSTQASRAIRPAPLAGVGVGLATALAALVVVLSVGSHPPPAYAVTLNPDRTVTITLREYQAVGKLNARLVALHTRIRVVPIIPGCVAPVHGVSDAFGPGYKNVIPGPAKTLEVQSFNKDFSDTISVDTLSGRTLVLAVTRSGMQGTFSAPVSGVVVGPAPRCVGNG